MPISSVAGAHLELRSSNGLMLDTLGMGRANLRRRLTPLLPAKLVPEALETAGIHGIVGRSGGRTALVTSRPFRAPHHTISDVRLIGGQIPMPGEVSRAYHGVRFMDELPGFRHVREVLRQPVEESVIYIQSRGRPRSEYIQEVSHKGDGHEGFGQSPLTSHHRDGHHTTASPLPS